MPTLNFDVTRLPDCVYVFHDDAPKPVIAVQTAERWNTPHAEVNTVHMDGLLSVDVHCAKEPIARVALRWKGGLSGDVLLLGDAWERGYGDLQWRCVQPE